MKQPPSHRPSYADECSPCLSSHDRQLHCVHRAANQTGPDEVNAQQSPGERFSQDHVVAASLRNRLPPGQQKYRRGGSSSWILLIVMQMRLAKTNDNVSLAHGVYFFPPDLVFGSHTPAVKPL